MWALPKIDFAPLGRTILRILRGIPEPLFVAVFCVLPLGISAISKYYGAYKAHSINNNLPEADFSIALSGTISHGEMFLYCFSLFGSLMWLCAIDPPSSKFKLRWLFILIVTAVGIFSIALYAMNPDQREGLPPIFITASLIFYCIYLAIYVILITAFSEPANLSESYGKGAKSMIDGMSPGAGQ